MIQLFSNVLRRRRLRHSVLAVLAALVATACESSNPLASAPDEGAQVAATTDTTIPVDSLVPALASTSYSGIAFGPTSLWSSYTGVHWGPAMFTGSQVNVYSNGMITLINSARAKRQRIVTAMTGGSASDFTTRGKFDLDKWKRKMASFNTSAIRNAVAAAVADGTIIGNTMIDEPETPKWGGNISKGTIDNMAAYAKGIFPTLPMGINIGPPAYKWRASERFQKLDWVRYQYNWWISNGNVGAWRDAVLAQARRDGVTPAFSLNLLDGGTKDQKGGWDCPGTGRGTYAPNCRMTPDQVRSYGRAIAGSGCVMMMWRYDNAFISKSANQDAFRDIASVTNSSPRRSCRRP